MNNDYISNRLNNYFNDLLNKNTAAPSFSKNSYDFINRNMLFIIIIILTILFFTYRYYYRDFELKNNNFKIINKKNNYKKKLNKEKIKNNNNKLKIKKEKEQLLSIIDELSNSIDEKSYIEHKKQIETPLPPPIPTPIPTHTAYNQNNMSSQFSSVNNNKDTYNGYDIIPPYMQ